MRKFFVAAVPILTLVLFIAVMFSGNFLKKPLGADDNIPRSINNLIKTIQDEQWEEAGIKAEELSKAWKKVVSRVQFSTERDEINFFSMAIARLQGAIIEKDRSSAIIELKEAYEHWDQLAQ